MSRRRGEFLFINAHIHCVSSGVEETKWVVYALLMSAKLIGIKTEFNVIVKEAQEQVSARCRSLSLFDCAEFRGWFEQHHVDKGAFSFTVINLSIN